MSNIYQYIEYSNYVPKSTQIVRKLCKNPMRRAPTVLFLMCGIMKCANRWYLTPSCELSSIAAMAWCDISARCCCALNNQLSI